MKIAFLGTPAIAATCLESLAQGPHTISAVVTHPDKAQGRGLRLQPTPVKEAALRLGLPVLECPDAKAPGFAQALREMELDLLVVVAFVVLPREVLAATRLGAINLHGSLLPKWRGAAPVQRAVESGEPVTGATVFRLDTGVDTGGILLQEEIAVGADETSGEVLARLATLGGPLLGHAIDRLEQDPSDAGIPQDKSLATRAPKLFPEEGELDWKLPAQRLHDKVRAFHPAPGCWTTVEGVRLKVWRTRSLTEIVPHPVGTAMKLPGNRIAVACGQGAVELVEVQPEGKKRLPGPDWFNGLRRPDGVPLGT